MIEFDLTKKDVYHQKYDYSYTDEASVALEDAEKKLTEIFENNKNCSVLKTRALCIEYMLKHARLPFSRDELFVGGIEYDNFLGKRRYKMLMELTKNDDPSMFILHDDSEESGAYTGDCDFGHNHPNYETLFNKGIGGIILEVKDKLSACESDKKEFYESVITVYEAIKSYILRFALMCEKHKDESDIARLRYTTLVNISHKPPQNLFEALQLQIIIYHLIQTLTENTTRSLGLWDKLLYPYYKKDIENGTFSVDDVKNIFRHCMIYYRAIHFSANIPFMLCGVDENVKDASNELTRLILDTYISLDIKDPKIQVRYHEDIPDDILEMIVKSIAKGRNSFVFVNDEVVIKGLKKLGAEHKDAIDYGIVGCYEPLCAGKEIAATCSGRVMLPKAIEYVFTKGVDLNTGKLIGAITPDISYINTFDAFYEAVKKQLSHFCEKSIELTLLFEKRYKDVQSSPILSALIDGCTEKGLDAYHGGAKYNNTSINVLGTATAADILTAIKLAVFEEERITLQELFEILKSNWQGEENEKLRLEIMKKYPKYGNGEVIPDSFAKELISYCAANINGIPNVRDGVFRVGAFSIDWAYTFGAKTLASADGRRNRDPYSKNMCSATARDKKGVSSLIRSVTSIDYTETPNGTVLDLMLHRSALKGEDGIRATVGLIKTYMKLKGFAIQINVFDPEILHEAQRMPEKYSTLQVRRCGWNVYFNELDRAEQDEFIKQAENL